MNNYLIPANSKKSMLIFGWFTPFDLIVFGIGAVFSILMLLMITTNNINLLLLMISPLLVTGFLVLPVPNYHNIMTLSGNVLFFYMNRRRCYGKGWCARDVYKDDGGFKSKF